MGFFDFMTEEIAIDLGTANTLIIHLDKVVVDSPSIVARDRVSGKIIAVGREANMMQGKTHENIKTIRPLKDGVIADFDASEKMISMFIKNIPALKKNGSRRHFAWSFVSHRALQKWKCVRYVSLRNVLTVKKYTLFMSPWPLPLVSAWTLCNRKVI